MKKQSPLSKIKLAMINDDYPTIAKILHKNYKSFSIIFQSFETHISMQCYDKNREFRGMVNMSFGRYDNLKKEIRKVKIENLNA